MTGPCREAGLECQRPSVSLHGAARGCVPSRQEDRGIAHSHLSPSSYLIEAWPLAKTLVMVPEYHRSSPPSSRVYWVFTRLPILIIPFATAVSAATPTPPPPSGEDWVLPMVFVFCSGSIVFS